MNIILGAGHRLDALQRTAARTQHSAYGFSEHVHCGIIAVWLWVDVPEPDEPTLALLDQHLTVPAGLELLPF